MMNPSPLSSNKHQLGVCPLCNGGFPMVELEQHAAYCTFDSDVGSILNVEAAPPVNIVPEFESNIIDTKREPEESDSEGALE